MGLTLRVLLGVVGFEAMDNVPRCDVRLARAGEERAICPTSVGRASRRRAAAEQWVSVTEGNDLGIRFYLARGFIVRERVSYIVADDGIAEGHSLRMRRSI